MNSTPQVFKYSLSRLVRPVLAVILATATFFCPAPSQITLAGAQVDIPGYPGSGQFGHVTVLPNGNIVVADPGYDAPGPISDVGAVYLLNGATGSLISALTGSTAGDNIGSGGVTVLNNGNYVILSPSWANSGAANAGAATWGSAAAGVSGLVSAANSLVGAKAFDGWGSSVTPLANGNYVVVNITWDNNGGANNKGAVTWGSGATGVSGVISAANSLVGSTGGGVGSGGVTPLTNGNYVVMSYLWDNGPAADAGAVTWADGTVGITGTVSPSNSLVGSTANEAVGGVHALKNGNYLVTCPSWSNGKGAATWGSGTSGVSGLISAANSLVGSTPGDYVGARPITELSNGNYVVDSPDWNHYVGAVTWGSGTAGVSGVVSATNSLVGSISWDYVGDDGVWALTNGNYVVASPRWHNNGAANVGAVTWGSGATGVTGLVSEANSLVGSTADDWVGVSRITALTNGNYVVRSPYWDNGGAADAGAVTWGNGATGLIGVVSAANSLVGSTASDNVGFSDVTALTNGNYVVASPLWNRGSLVDAGAATWGSGTAGVSGPISAANSLAGMFYDKVGSGGVTALTNGNYVVNSPHWNGSSTTRAGAVTWGSGTAGVKGVVSATNSLIGSTADDRVGYGGVTAIANGGYVVLSPYWDHGAAWDAGAITLGVSGDCTPGPTTGIITTGNSVLGAVVNGGIQQNFAFDPVNRQLVVGRPADNVVSLYRTGICFYTYVPTIKK